MDHPITPFIRTALYDVITPPVHVCERVIFDYELLYLKSGFARVIFDGQVYESTTNCAFLLRPGIRHTVDFFGDGQIIQPHIHFDLLYRENRRQIPVSFKNLGDMTSQERQDIHPDIVQDFTSQIPVMVKLQSPAVFEMYLFDAITEFSNPNPLSQLKANGLLLLALNHYLMEAKWHDVPSLRSKNDIDLKIIKNYIESKSKFNLSMEDLSKVFFIEKHHLAKTFKSRYGETPMQYHTRLRINLAKKLMCLTNLSLSEIAENVGYSSIHSFSKAFKQRVGVSPIQYRTSALGEDTPPD